MVDFFTTGAETCCEGRSLVATGVGEGVEIGSGTATAFVSWVSLTFKVGEEKVKPAALKWSQPFCSLTTVVATLCCPPSADVMLTLAEIGALLNL